MKITKALIILMLLVLTATLFGCNEISCNHNYTEATCTDPAECTKCGEIFEDALGHDYSDATCVLAERCNTCGETKGEALGHDFKDATCTSPSTCSRCDATQGAPLGHAYQAATCTDPEKCNNCGHIKSLALGHSYIFENGATCTTAVKCTRCETKGTAVKGHEMKDATCTTPEYCTVCGMESASALGHNFTNATCTNPQICKRCEIREGSPLPHDYTEATCTVAKTCKTCGITNGEPLGHTYLNKYCIRCEQRDPETVFANLIVITSDDYTHKKGKFVDTFGNEYEESSVFKFYHGNIYSGTEANSLYNLNKKFSQFSGTFVAGQDMGNRVKINIYLDDKLVHSIDSYTRNTGPVNFSINVSGVTKLAIQIVDEKSNVHGSSYTQVALVNAELTK